MALVGLAPDVYMALACMAAVGAVTVALPAFRHYTPTTRPKQ
jgi:hypothetical protein